MVLLEFRLVNIEKGIVLQHCATIFQSLEEAFTMERV
jgi:hypothetical protein